MPIRGIPSLSLISIWRRAGPFILDPDLPGRGILFIQFKKFFLNKQLENILGP